MHARRLNLRHNELRPTHTKPFRNLSTADPDVGRPSAHACSRTQIARFGAAPDDRFGYQVSIISGGFVCGSDARPDLTA